MTNNLVIKALKNAYYSQNPDKNKQIIVHTYLGSQYTINDLKELYKEFNRNNNTFVAPTDYIEGNGSLLFIVNLFYHLSKGSNFKDSFARASSIDTETELYALYS